MSQKKTGLTASRDFPRGLKDGIPIALGYLSVSFTFGIQGIASGLTILETLLISMTNLTSAGQFAGLPLIVGGGSLIEMAMTQLVINLRYALMSLSLGQKLDSGMTTPRRALFAFFNTDEIFATASAHEGKVGRQYLSGLALTPYFGWALGTLLGAAAGSLLPDFVRTALGIAIYGMFLAIIIPPARRQKSARVVVLAAACMSIAFRYLPFLSGFAANYSGFVIIICAVSAAALGALLFPVEDEEGQS